ncbi:MAG: BamA/TamA family outer membrane protein [Ignavibacteria bacterium]|nr:BamA/TamA family outer membrane protein [Ignavibacteria bacterium]
MRRSFDGKATVLLSSTLSVSAGVQGIRVIPALNTVLTTLPSSSTLSGSVELLIDTRDNPFNPRSGVQLRNSYAGGSKSFTRPGAIDREHDAVQRIEADVSWFRELFTRGIVAVAVHGRELRGGSLDASDLYRLGGASTLRGYREEQFSGTRLAWSNLEFRYSLGGRSFAFVFFDFGYIYSAPGEAPAREELTVTRNGYGIGGRLETGLGVLGVSYALGQGDSFSSGKIHFGLINEF